MLHECWSVLEDGGVGWWRFCSETFAEQVGVPELLQDVFHYIDVSDPESSSLINQRGRLAAQLFNAGNTEALFRPPDTGSTTSALNGMTFLCRTKISFLQ